MSKAIVIEIHKQLVGVEVIQSPNAIITTTRVEMVVAPNTNVVRSGILIGFATNLGHGLGTVMIGRNLSQSSGRPIVIITVIGTHQMVSTNLIMITHVNRITNQPPMNSMVVGRYINKNVENRK
jgi:hypothetical protein